MPIDAALTRRRLRAQLLAGPAAANPLEAVRRLLAVQAQDLDGARLALQARARPVSTADIDRALCEVRSLIVTWLNRGTLHLIAAEDYWWLLPLTAPPVLRANVRLLGQLGISPAQSERGVELIAATLAAAGPTRQGELRERLRAAGIPVAGQAGYLLLAQSSLRGRTIRGPVVDGEQAYVLTRDWLGRPPPPLPRDRALALLARRYLAGHGPAEPADLARWAGIGLRDARAGLASLGPSDDRASSRASRARARPRLLGPFDPVMFGWVDRGPLLGAHEPELVTSNGLFRPAILARDRIVGGWRLVGGAVVLTPFEPLTDGELDALQRDARDLVRFVDGA